ISVNAPVDAPAATPVKACTAVGAAANVPVRADAPTPLNALLPASTNVPTPFAAATPVRFTLGADDGGQVRTMMPLAPAPEVALVLPSPPEPLLRQPAPPPPYRPPLPATIAELAPV